MTAPSTDRLLLASAMMGQFITGFASRIFAVALPTISVALHADIIAIAWALIAYQIAGISLSVVFGRMGDIRGRSTIYALGFAIMGVSSLACGFAPDVGWLILFRLVQGVGAAMIASATRVLALEAMPSASAGRANGYMTMSFHGGLLLGPPVGGFVIDLLTWRWVFFMLVPVGVAGVLLTVVRARRQPARIDGPARIDHAGAGLLVVLSVFFTLLLDQRVAELLGTGQRGLLAVGFGITLAAFLIQELRVAEPIVNLALFRIRMFSFSVLSLLLTSTTYNAVGLLMPFYMQDVLHLSPSAMGLVFLSAPIFTIALAAVSGRLADRIGPRIPTSIGVVLTASSFAVGILMRPDSHWILPALVMALGGIGTGFFNTSNQMAIVGSVPREYRGFATGMVQMVFGSASLIGTTLTGVLLTALFRMYSGAPDAIASASDPHAFVAAMRTIYGACLGVLAIALVCSFLRGGRKIESARLS